MEAKETKQMAGMEMGEACCRTERTPAEQKKLLTRLKTVEGQIKGIQKMVEADAYCPDILMQVSAVCNALNSFNKLLLAPISEAAFPMISAKDGTEKWMSSAPCSKN